MMQVILLNLIEDVEHLQTTTTVNGELSVLGNIGFCDILANCHFLNLIKTVLF